MKIFIFLLITLPTLGFSQNRIEFSNNGFSPSTITEVPGKTKSEIYTAALNWVNKNYSDPQRVLKGTVQDEYIRIEGIDGNLFCLKSGCHEGKYQVEISVADNQYKFEVVQLRENISGWIPVDFNQNKSFYFDSKGLKPKFALFEKIPVYFNSLNQKLQQEILVPNSL